MFILMTAVRLVKCFFGLVEFPWTAFFTGCNFVLLLFKKEQGYFPLFPSTKHPRLGCFLPLSLLFQHLHL